MLLKWLQHAELMDRRSYIVPQFSGGSMEFMSHKQQRMLYYYFLGYEVPTTVKMLKVELLLVSGQGVQKFWKSYCKTGMIRRSGGSGRRSKISQETLQIV